MMRKCLFHGEEATQKVGGAVYEKRYGWMVGVKCIKVPVPAVFLKAG
jgi:hypothetical protein